MGLSVRDLAFRYPGAGSAGASGGAPVLQGISLEVPDGGIFGLLGPNGAGKTTLLSVLTGQLRGAQGAIEVRGRVGLVPQDHAFYPMLTCRENLRFFAEVQGIGRRESAQRVAAVAAFARIEPMLERRAGLLSGGLKRRLNLAIGMLTDPDVLLLDEPTVGVDPQSRAFLLDSIRALARPGRTIVYTSHYMEEVQALCDRVAILDAGRVLASGTLDELLHENPGERELHVRVPEAGAEAVIAAAEQAGGEVTHGRRDLEQVFMQLTNRSLRDQ